MGIENPIPPKALNCKKTSEESDKRTGRFYAEKLEPAHGNRTEKAEADDRSELQK